MERICSNTWQKLPGGPETALVGASISRKNVIFATAKHTLSCLKICKKWGQLFKGFCNFPWKNRHSIGLLSASLFHFANLRCCATSQAFCVQVQGTILSPTHPTPPRHLRSISHVFEIKESQWRSIQHVCKSERNILLRSIKNVCKCKERYCPQPTPPHPITSVASHMCSRPRKVNDVASDVCASQRETSCCVASKMCASARNVTVPNPPHPTPSLA